MHDSIPSAINSDVAFVSSFTAPPKANLPRPSGTLSLAKYNTIHPSHSPLSPQRLAKLANALGVITPIPVDSSPISKHSKSSQSPDVYSASVASTSANYPNVKYVIHVIPPLHFPHDLEDDPEGQATFRRGLLIPVRPTLKSQISAIAREYKMPSTSGITLYLMGMPEEIAIPGPRITEDVWKLFWTVISNEGRERDTNFEPSSNEPKAISDSSLRDFTSSFMETFSSSLNPMLSAENIKPYGSPPERFVQSSMSLNSNKVTASTNSGQILVNQLLPGLKSSALIPILAKIEFDVEHKNGGWYDAWSRSRRHKQLLFGHPKRELLPENVLSGQMVLLRNSSNTQSTVLDKVKNDRSMSKGALHIMSKSENIAGYSSKVEDFRNGGGILSQMHKSLILDPVLDVARKTINNDDLVANNGNTSTILFVGAPHEEKGAISSSSNYASSRKHAPPPLRIPDRLDHHPHADEDLMAAAHISQQSRLSHESSRSMEEFMEDFARADFIDERRVGGIYDDIELDFNLAELQDDSGDEEKVANDVRWHQLRMRKELDVLEKNIAQLSPRQLRSNEAWNSSSQKSVFSNHKLTVAHLQNVDTRSSSLHAMTRDLSARDSVPLTPAFQHIAPARPSIEVEEEVISTPPVFRQPVLVGTPSPVLPDFRALVNNDTETNLDFLRESDVKDSHNIGHPSWPSIPFASLRDRNEIVLPPQANFKGPQSVLLKEPLPQLIADKNSRSFLNAQEPLETGYENLYHGNTILPPSLTREESKSVVQSPIIPLSPNPFGRNPSDIPQSLAKMSNRSWFKGRTITGDEDINAEHILDNVEASVKRSTSGSNSHLSRFSADSISEDVKVRSHKDRSTLISVKRISRLWRKSNKSISFISSANALGGSQNSGVDIERKGSPIVLTPPIPGVKFDDSIGVELGRHIRSDSALDPFHFDQASSFKGSLPRQSSNSNTSTPSSSISNYSKSEISISSVNDMIGGPGRPISKSWKANAEPLSPERPNHILEQVTNGRWHSSSSEVSSDILHGPTTVPRHYNEYKFDQGSRVVRDSSSVSSRRKPAPSSSTDSQTSSPSIATPVMGSSSPRMENSAVSLSPRGSEDSNLEKLTDVATISSQIKVTDSQSSFAKRMFVGMPVTNVYAG